MQLLFLQQWLPDEILKAIGWTLIHSLWQGLLAAVLAGIIIISTKRAEARHRYNLLGVILVLFIITSGITFSQQLKNPAAAVNPFAGLSVSVSENSFVVDNYEVTAAQEKSTLGRLVAYVNANAGFFVLIWGIFFLFHCIKLFTGLAGIERIRNYKINKAPPEWVTKMDQLCKTLHVKQTVGLLQSGLVKVPVAIGFFKPVILVPLGLLSNLPAEQVETILLHELAHIRRKDYLVNIIQRFTEAVFFFNPALLWISSLVRQEREACCDDIVVANTTDKGSYLAALVSFHEYSFPASRYAMAINSKQHYLLNRVKRMITRENKKLDIMEKIFLAAGLVVVTAFTFIPKKDAVTKKNVTVATTSNEPVAVTPVMAKPVPLSGIREPRQSAGKKETLKPVIEMARNILPADTVPSSKKEKTGYDDLKFPSVSSTVNDDGTTRTETTTVTDQDGKKYTYSKLNNKITSLSIDGKAVPENEIGNYSSLFHQIEATIQENKIKRLLSIDQRKAERAEKNENMKNKIAEKRLLQQYHNAQKDYLHEQTKQSKLLEKSKKTLDDQRKETLKLLRKLKDRKINVPMLNGREIIKNDKSKAADIVVETDLNNETVKISQVNVNLSKVNNNVGVSQRNVQVETQVPIPLKNEWNINFNMEPHKNFDYKPEIEQFNFSNETTNEKPRVPVKSAPGINSSRNVQQGKSRSASRESAGRRVTT